LSTLYASVHSSFRESIFVDFNLKKPYGIIFLSNKYLCRQNPIHETGFLILGFWYWVSDTGFLILGFITILCLKFRAHYSLHAIFSSPLSIIRQRFTGYRCESDYAATLSIFVKEEILSEVSPSWTLLIITNSKQKHI